MSTRLRAAVVGAGFIGTVHAHAIQAAGAELAYVVDTDPRSVGHQAQRLRATSATTDLDEVLADDTVDVVHICTPNSSHVSLTTAVLKAGKHVICEKPIATDLGGASQLREMARLSDLVAAVPFVYRFYPTVRSVRSRIATGELGAVQLLHGSYLQDWLAGQDQTNWRVDSSQGGLSRAFGDIGVHWCDLMEFVTGHRIVSMCARMKTAHSSRRGSAVGTEDIAALLFETDKGALGSCVVSQVSLGRKNRLHLSVDGTDASASFDQQLPDTLWLGYRTHTTLVMRGADQDGNSTAYDVLPAGHPQGYQDCFNAFVGDAYTAMAGVTPSGLPTFEDGYRAAQLTNAVLTSAQSGEWVSCTVDEGAELRQVLP